MAELVVGGVLLGQVEEAGVGLKVHDLGVEEAEGLHLHQRLVLGVEGEVEEAFRIHRMGEGEVAREYCVLEEVEAHQLDQVEAAQRGLEPGVVAAEHGVSVEVKMGLGVAAVGVA